MTSLRWLLVIPQVIPTSQTYIKRKEEIQAIILGVNRDHVVETSIKTNLLTEKKTLERGSLRGDNRGYFIGRRYSRNRSQS